MPLGINLSVNIEDLDHPIVEFAYFEEEKGEGTPVLKFELAADQAVQEMTRDELNTERWRDAERRAMKEQMEAWAAKDFKADNPDVPEPGTPEAKKAERAAIAAAKNYLGHDQGAGRIAQVRKCKSSKGYQTGAGQLNLIGYFCSRNQLAPFGSQVSNAPCGQVAF